jgi:dCMP deaminase
MNWSEYALEVAFTVARKSKDPWRKVGACLLRADNTLAAVGYNGFPAGMEEDWADRDERRKLVVHAEQNALRYVVPGECALLAVTLLPCNDCLKVVAAYGIKKIVFAEDYEHDPSSLLLAEKFGIELQKISLT